VPDDLLERTCLRNPVADLLFGRQCPHKAFFLISTGYFFQQVGCITLGEFRDAIDTCTFQQLGVLTAYTLDAHQVGMVHQPQDFYFGDSGLLCNLLSALFAGTIFQQRLYATDPGL